MVKLTDTEWETLVQSAHDAGVDAGKNAAAWWEQDAIGGRATRVDAEDVRRFLQGLEDGDPEYLDRVPTVDLSGEWADGLTVADVLADILPADVDADDLTPEEVDELVDAFRQAADSAAYEDVERMCRDYLTNAEEV